jgi:ADP-dependent NAD(P)H-hydrate dehydratase / NAD(P)H-hydrate epimerase
VATGLRLRIAGYATFGLGVLSVALLVVGLLYVWSHLDRWVSRYVIDQAHERGVVLEMAGVDYGIGWVQLREPRFTLVGVHGIRGAARTVDVRFEHFNPTGIDADGVSVQIEGSAPVLALELSQWTRSYPSTYSLRAVARDVAVVWRPAPGLPAWVEISGATVVPTADGGAFSAKQARVASVALGEVGAGWSKTDATIGLGFGLASPDRAPVRLHVAYALARPVVEITVVPTDLAKLSGPLGVKIPIENVTASGNVRLELPPRDQTGEVTGSVHLELRGYVPPHPVELDGFVFGNLTTVDTRITVSADQQLVKLDDTKVKAGAFQLVGKGQVTRHEKYASVTLGLRGDLPCSALADAYAQNQLGGQLGYLAGKLAREAVQGSVAVLLNLEADTRDLAAARVERTIGMGCGLRPLDPGLLDRLQRVLERAGLPKLPKLPPLPSGLPPLPTAIPPFPDLRWVGRDAG